MKPPPNRTPETVNFIQTKCTPTQAEVGWGSDGGDGGGGSGGGVGDDGRRWGGGGGVGCGGGGVGCVGGGEILTKPQGCSVHDTVVTTGKAGSVPALPISSG